MLETKNIKAFNSKNIDAIGIIYCEVFIGSNYTAEDFSEAKKTITKQATYPGFKGVTYINGLNEIVGFSYGYRSTPGQFYREKLVEHFNKDERKKWLDDCFEFVELAVDPTCRQNGIGTQLHDSLLSRVNFDTSVLTTSTDNRPAINLYQKKEWQIIRGHAAVIPGTKPQVIMGKVLDN